MRPKVRSRVKGGLAIWPAAALLSFAIEANSGERLGVDPAFPSVGAHVQNAGTAELSLATWTVLQGAADNPPCALQTWLEIARFGSRNIHVVITAAATDTAVALNWLQSDAQLTEPASYANILGRLSDGVADALASLGDQDPPPTMTVKIRLVPDRCRYEETIVHDSAAGSQTVTFPVALRVSDVVDRASSKRLLFAILQIVSHEAAHVYQLTPLDVRSKAASVSLDSFQGPGGMTLNATLEFAAIMVDRCVRQALVPNDWVAELDARMWRDRPIEYRAASASDPWSSVFESVYATQQRALGKRFVNARENEELGILFGYCTMYMTRQGDPSPEWVPTHVEHRRGVEALQRIRDHHPPLFVKGLLYDDVPLP